MATVSVAAVASCDDWMIVKWASMASGDTINALELPGAAIALDWQVTGSHGGTTSLTGSNDGTTYANMSEGTGTDAAITANRCVSTRELPRYVKPSPGTGVTATDAVLKVTLRKSGNV